jgi:hypothetical protein
MINNDTLTTMWKRIINPNAEIKGYFLWKSNFDYWQVTKEDKEPVTDSGYYNLIALLKMKGI